MKKTISILLIVSIILSSLGIGFAMDYCPMKKKYSFSLQGNKLCGCKKTSHNKCCKSKVITFKKNVDNYEISEFQFNAPQLNFAIVQYASFIVKPVVLQNMPVFFRDSSPPGHSVSLNILFRSILI